MLAISCGSDIMDTSNNEREKIMGTRSLTYVYTEQAEFQGKVYKPRPLICMYRQYDGYPTGHGKEIAVFLKEMRVVNGLGVGEDNTMTANGMGCLAAQLVANFKVEAGQFYMEEAKLKKDCGQEYEYHVYENKVEIYQNWADKLYSVVHGLNWRFIALKNNMRRLQMMNEKIEIGRAHV